MNAPTMEWYHSKSAKSHSNALNASANGEISCTTVDLKSLWSKSKMQHSWIRRVFRPCIVFYSKNLVLSAVYLFKRMVGASIWYVANANMNSVGIASDPITIINTLKRGIVLPGDLFWCFLSLWYWFYSIKSCSTSQATSMRLRFTRSRVSLGVPWLI